ARAAARACPTPPPAWRAALSSVIIGARSRAVMRGTSGFGAPPFSATSRHLPSVRQLDLTKIGSIGRRTTDRIQCVAANEQVIIRPIRTERVIARRTEFLASLPPTVLAS